MLGIFRLGIDHRFRSFQPLQHSVEIIHLEIPHGRLRHRESSLMTLEKDIRDVRPAASGSEKESFRKDCSPQEAAPTPRKSLKIRCRYKRSAQPGDFSHECSPAI
jgi:hypothetical protein